MLTQNVVHGRLFVTQTNSPEKNVPRLVADVIFQVPQVRYKYPKQRLGILIRNL